MYVTKFTRVRENSGQFVRGLSIIGLSDSKDGIVFDHHSAALSISYVRHRQKKGTRYHRLHRSHTMGCKQILECKPVRQARSARVRTY